MAQAPRTPNNASRRQGASGASVTTRLTVADLIAAWRRDYLLYHRALRSLEGLVHFERAFGERLAADLKTSDIDRWRAMRRRAGIAPTTINRNVAALRGALGHAVAQGWLERSPLEGLRPLRTDEDTRVRWLTDAERRRLFAALQARDDRLRARRRTEVLADGKTREARVESEHAGFADALAPAVRLSLATGLRRGELLALRWSDITRQGLRIRAVNAKSRRTRWVPLNGEARDVLARWQRQCAAPGLVFQGRGGGPIRSLRTAWENLLHTARIEDFRWHDLRHDFASRLVMAGVPLNTVRELLGHRDPKLTLRYAHLAKGHLQTAVDALDGITGQDEDS